MSGKILSQRRNVSPSVKNDADATPTTVDAPALDS